MSGSRHAPLDVMRGLAIVLMTLDHVRGFIAPLGADPTDLAQTSVPFFLVRWITHLCAPTFVLLMGAGAALRHRSRPDEMPAYLLKRGIWIVFLEVSWISFSFFWSFSLTYLGVLWALGGAMILMAPLTRLPHKVMLTAGLVLTLSFDLFAPSGDISGVGFLFGPTRIMLAGHPVQESYALLPWLAVAMVGWGLGPWMVRASARQILGLGAGCLSVFLVLRGLTLGDPSAWTSQSRGTAFTVMDFMNPSKYPPSLAFLLLTLGAAFLLLGSFARREGVINRCLQLFGQVPLFFYLLHLPLTHALANAWAWSMYGQARVPGTVAVSFTVIVGCWAIALALLWPASKAWLNLKRAHPEKRWLRYL